MDNASPLKTRAKEFVIAALTQAATRLPTKHEVEVAADRIAKALNSSVPPEPKHPRQRSAK